MGQGAFKDCFFLPENLMKKHAWVAEEEESWWLLCTLAFLKQFTRTDDNILYFSSVLTFWSVGTL